MRRFLLITLSLVLALGGWSTIGAEAQVSNKVVVIPIFTDDNVAPVTKTGQTTSYGTGDDGDWHKGVVGLTPRFTDNGNGTVTDNLTRLVWMKNASALGVLTWANALTTANTLASGSGDLNDGSQAGDWRLPNVRELQSLFDYGRSLPALPADHPFDNVQLSWYWSSTTGTPNNLSAWYVNFTSGNVSNNGKSTGNYVWCVRGGP
jgi:hypothetical protein